MSVEMDLVYCHVLQFIILIAGVRKEPSELRGLPNTGENSEARYHPLRNKPCQIHPTV